MKKPFESLYFSLSDPFKVQKIDIDGKCIYLVLCYYKLIKKIVLLLISEKVKYQFWFEDGGSEFFDANLLWTQNFIGFVPFYLTTSDYYKGMNNLGCCVDDIQPPVLTILYCRANANPLSME